MIFFTAADNHVAATLKPWGLKPQACDIFVAFQMGVLESEVERYISNTNCESRIMVWELTTNSTADVASLPR